MGYWRYGVTGVSAVEALVHVAYFFNYIHKKENGNHNDAHYYQYFHRFLPIIRSATVGG